MKIVWNSNECYHNITEVRLANAKNIQTYKHSETKKASGPSGISQIIIVGMSSILNIIIDQLVERW